MASPDEFYNGTLDAFIAGTLEKYKVFDLGLSPNLNLKALPRATVFMPQSVMHKAVNKHRIDLGVLRNLPSAIRDPNKIYNSKSSASSVILLLDLRDAGTQLVAVAEYVRHSDFGMSYMVKSIHHRPVDQLERWEGDGLLFYKKEDQIPPAGLSSL